MSTRAIYAFSGDPITYGHIDIIKRAHQLFGSVIVAIGTNPDKNYTFTAKERKNLAQEALDGLSNVTVKSFTGLLVDFAYEQQATVIVKGVRNQEDFRYEQALSHVSLSQDQGIETILLFAKKELAHVSSSTVKALQKENGLTQNYVPLSVKVALEKKISNQVIVGVTGEIATGKTHLAKLLKKHGKEQGIEVHNIELDKLAHEIQNELQEPQYKALRKKIADTFGQEILRKNDTIDRQKLGEVVFSDLSQLEKLNKLMWKPVLVRLRRKLRNKKGLIMINSALIAEADLMAVCNNKIILTKTSEKLQKERLIKRGFDAGQIKRRIDSQLSTEKKQQILEKTIKDIGFGKIWEINTINSVNNPKDIKEKKNLSSFAKQLFSEIL